MSTVCLATCVREDAECSFTSTLPLSVSATSSHVQKDKSKVCGFILESITLYVVRNFSTEVSRILPYKSPGLCTEVGRSGPVSWVVVRQEAAQLCSCIERSNSQIKLFARKLELPDAGSFCIHTSVLWTYRYQHINTFADHESSTWLCCSWHIDLHH